VFSATGTSHQISLESASFFNIYTCAAIAVPNVAGMTQANATTASGNVLY
jgi:hypothetical protein